MSIKKLKKCKVTTPKGDRFLTFRPVSADIPLDQLICDAECPYSKVCDKLPDPRNPEDKDLCFMDFCGNLGDEESSQELGDMVPVDGTIEEALSDFPDIFQILIERNPVVRLKKIVDNFCSTWCDVYQSDYSMCCSENKSCIMNELFLGQKKLVDTLKNKEDIKEDAENNG